MRILSKKLAEHSLTTLLKDTIFPQPKYMLHFIYITYYISYILHTLHIIYAHTFIKSLIMADTWSLNFTFAYVFFSEFLSYREWYFSFYYFRSPKIKCLTCRSHPIKVSKMNKCIKFKIKQNYNLRVGLHICYRLCWF